MTGLSPGSDPDYRGGPYRLKRGVARLGAGKPEIPRARLLFCERTPPARQSRADKEQRMSMFQSLMELAPHTAARIHSVGGAAGTVARLEALGLCAGRAVRVIKRGEPCILQVYATRIGLASELARNIVVAAE